MPIFKTKIGINQFPSETRMNETIKIFITFQYRANRFWSVIPFL